MLKEQARDEEFRRQRESTAIPKLAPRLPDLSPTPQIKTFGGDDRPDSVAIISNRLGNRPTSPLPVTVPVMVKENIDPYARTESITHRGRYSYASSAVSTINTPRRLRRRKDPTPYNILVIGTRNSGKTSFLNFLRTSLALPPNKHPIRSPEEFDMPDSSQVNRKFTSHYLETEIDGERVGLTLWDSQGLERDIIDLQLREITAFLESKFEDTLAEEMKVIRSPGVRDTHIHCVFLIIDPVRLDANTTAMQTAANGVSTKFSESGHIVGVLDEGLDLQVLHTIMGKTTVVPVISKADTITTAHMAYLKKAVWDSLKQANIDPLEALSLDDLEDDSSYDSTDRFDEREEDESEARSTAEGDSAIAHIPESDAPAADDENPTPTSLSGQGQMSKKSNLTDAPPLPLSILSPDPYSLESKTGPIGRHFPWGFADPYNPEHCDFLKLKDSVFKEWRSDLREASREVWYERWRTSRLNRHTHGSSAKNRFSTKSGPPATGRVAR